MSTLNAVAARLPPIVLALAKKKAHLQCGYSLADYSTLHYHLVSGSFSALPTVLVCILLKRPLPLESPATDALPPSLSPFNLKKGLALLLYLVRVCMGYASYFTVWEWCKSPTVAALLQRRLHSIPTATRLVPSPSVSSVQRVTALSAGALDIFLSRCHYFIINFIASMAAGIAYRVGTWPIDYVLNRTEKVSFTDKCKASMKGAFISFCIIQSIILRDRWLSIH